MGSRDYNFSQTKILIADDHQPMRRVMRGIMRELGIGELEHVNNGEAALQMMPGFQPDVLVTDFMMQPMNGLELIHVVRSGQAGVDRFLPIIMVSAYTEVHEVIKARDAGATEFLAKPISAKMVYYRLRSIVENPRQYVDSVQYFGPDRRRREAELDLPNRRLMAYEYLKNKAGIVRLGGR